MLNTYQFSEIEQFLDSIKDNGEWKSKKQNHSPFYTIKYNNTPCSISQKSSNINVNGHHTGLTYLIAFNMGGNVILMRDWAEFIVLLDKLKETFDLYFCKRLVIFCDDLAFDYQFFKSLGDSDDMFLMESRKALYIVFNKCFELRSVHLLTNSSIEDIADSLTKYKVELSELDEKYKDMIITPESEIPQELVNDCVNKSRVIVNKVQELIEEEKDGIGSLPSTMTRYTMRNLTEAVLNNTRAKAIVSNLRLSLPEYRIWLDAYQGGAVFCNPKKEGRTITDENGTIVCYDWISAYISRLISELYPMSNGVKMDIHTEEELKELIKSKIVVFRITYHNLDLLDDSPTPIIKKCLEKKTKEGRKNIVLDDNENVISASILHTTCTVYDYLAYRDFYSYDKAEITECWAYEPGFMLKPIVEEALKYYNLKTTLKGETSEDGSIERKYLLYKQCLNCIYGCMVEAIIHGVFDTYASKEKDVTEEYELKKIRDYNNNKKRVLFYPWGVIVSASNRYALYKSIKRLGKYNWLYSDTDSNWAINNDNFKAYIDEYNKEIVEKEEQVLDHLGIDKSLIRPKKNNKEYVLGQWSIEHDNVKAFKSLGAKLYCFEDDKGFQTTASGIPKKRICDALQAEISPFDSFKVGFNIDANKSGKYVHYFDDETIEFDIVDYQGIERHCISYGGVNKVPTNFSLGNTGDYEFLVKVIRNKII